MNTIITDNNVVVKTTNNADTVEIQGQDVTLEARKGDDHITVSNSHNTIRSGDGNDQIYVGDATMGYDDININAGKGDDLIVTYGDNHVINGGGGNDTITTNGSNITINGGNENDIITHTGDNAYITTGGGLDTVDVSGENITVRSGKDRDVIHLDGANANIFTNAGDDYVRASSDFANIHTGDGSDVVVVSGNFVDVDNGRQDDLVLLENTSDGSRINGSKDIDTILLVGAQTDYEFIKISSTEYLVRYLNGPADAIGNIVRNIENVIFIDEAVATEEFKDNLSFDSITGMSSHVIADIAEPEQPTIETIKYTDADEVINIDPSNNVRYVLRDGNDDITLAGDWNRIDAGNGNDIINITGDMNDVFGSNGNDVITASGNLNRYELGKGDNRIDLVGNHNRIASNNKNNPDLTQTGADIINVTGHGNKISASDGQDQITVIGHNNTINGGKDNDTINVDGHNNLVHAGDGDDTVSLDDNISITVTGSHNRVHGNSGDDTISVVGEHNHVRGGRDNDHLISDGDYNELRGNHGDDIIDAKGDHNVIGGGRDKDTINYEGDHGRLHVYDGDDTVDVLGNYNNVKLSSGLDVATVTGDNNSVYGGRDADDITVAGNRNLVQSGDGDNVVSVTGNLNNIRSSRDNDDITISGDDNTVFTNAGDDVVRVSGTNNYIDGGNGVDKVVLAGAATDYTVTKIKNNLFEVTNAAGTLTVELKNVTNASFAADETLSYTLEDLANGVIDPAVLKANNDEAETGENTAITVDVLANDENAQNITLLPENIEIIAGLGTVSIVDNKISYDPGTSYDYLALDEMEVVQIRYTISDGTTTSDAVLTLDIKGENDAVSVSLNNNVSKNESEANDAISIDPLLTIEDADTSDMHIVSIAANSANADFSDFVFENGLLFINKDYNFLAGGATPQTETILFDVTVDDGNGSTDTVTLSVTINGENDAPTLEVVGDALTNVQENEPDKVIAQLAGSDVDAGDAVSFRTVELDSPFSINASNQLILSAQDYEALVASGSTTLSVDVVAVDSEGLESAPRTFSVEIGNKNEAPSIALNNAVTNLLENSAELKVADIVITDDALGTNALSLGGADAAFFEIVGTELRLIASPDFEAKSSYSVDVIVNDGENPISSVSYNLTVDNENEAPSIALNNAVANLLENSAELKVADIVITDDALGTNALSLGGADAAFFEIVGTELRLIASPDFEAKSSYSVDVIVNDGENPISSVSYNLTVDNENEAPTDIAVTPVIENPENKLLVYENAEGAIIGNVNVTDAEGNTNPRVDPFQDQGFLFEINAEGQLKLVDGVSLDYENFTDDGQPREYTFLIAADNGPELYFEQFVVEVIDVNEAPALEVVGDALTNVQENEPDKVIAQLAGSDVDAGDAVSFRIVELELDSPFSINASNQLILSAQDYEALVASGSTTLSVDVVAVDSEGLESAPRTFSVEIDDTPNEVIQNDIAENARAGDTIISLDLNPGERVEILSIEDNLPVSVSGGDIILDSSSALDFEAKSSYSLSYRVVDSNNNEVLPQVDTSITVTDVQPGDGTNGNYFEFDINTQMLPSDPQALEGADFRQADLQNADLAGYNLNSADLRDASLDGTALTGASLRDVDFTDAEFNNVQLIGADLRGAILDFTQLQNTNILSETHFLYGAVINESDSNVIEIISNDVAVLGSIDDKLIGNAEDNVLDGGFGQDLYIGGAGADTFIYSFDSLSIQTIGDTKTIVDFTLGEDKLDLSNTISPSLNEIVFTVDGNNTIVTNSIIGSFELFIVEGIDYDALSAADKALFESSIILNSAPEIGLPSSVTIAENEAGAVLADVSITDADGHAIDSRSISISGPNSDKFEIVDDNGQLKLKLKVGESLDFEAVQSFDLTISAADEYSVVGSSIVSVNVQDTPDVAENAKAGDSIISLDLNPGERIEILSVEDDLPLVVSANGDSILLDSSSALDFEAKSSYALSYRVVDSSNNEVLPQVDTSITVTDVQPGDGTDGNYFEGSFNLASVDNFTTGLEGVDIRQATAINTNLGAVPLFFEGTAGSNSVINDMTVGNLVLTNSDFDNATIQNTYVIGAANGFWVRDNSSIKGTDFSNSMLASIVIGDSTDPTDIIDGTNADFSGIKYGNATIDNAILVNADFSGSVLKTRAIGEDGFQQGHTGFMSVNNTDMSGVDFSNAILQQANFVLVSLEGADFSNLNSTFSGSVGAYVSVNAKDAIFDNANYALKVIADSDNEGDGNREESDYTNASLLNATFNTLDLRGEVVLDGADFSGSSIDFFYFGVNSALAEDNVSARGTIFDGVNISQEMILVDSVDLTNASFVDSSFNRLRVWDTADSAAADVELENSDFRNSNIGFEVVAGADANMQYAKLTNSSFSLLNTAGSIDLSYADLRGTGITKAQLDAAGIANVGAEFGVYSGQIVSMKDDADGNLDLSSLTSADDIIYADNRVNTFIYSSSLTTADVIVMFEDSIDKIDFSSTAITGMNDLMIESARGGRDVVIKASDGVTELIVLEDFDINNVDATDFVFNDAPNIELTTAQLEVDENDATNPVIATLNIADADGIQSVVVDDPRFEVVLVSGDQYALKLKENESLNHEAEPLVDVKVTVTDSLGAMSELDLQVTVINIPEAPTSIELSNLEVASDSAGAVIGDLTVEDQDSETFTYEIRNNGVIDDRFEVVNGQLKLKDGESLSFDNDQGLVLNITAIDSTGLSTNQDFAVEVVNVISVAENAVAGDVIFNDPDAVVSSLNIKVLDATGNEIVLQGPDNTSINFGAFVGTTAFEIVFNDSDWANDDDNTKLLLQTQGYGLKSTDVPFIEVSENGDFVLNSSNIFDLAQETRVRYLVEYETVGGEVKTLELNVTDSQTGTGLNGDYFEFTFDETTQLPPVNSENADFRQSHWKVDYDNLESTPSTDLSNYILNGANFSGALMLYVGFLNSQMVEADFSYAIGLGIDFSGSNLYKADFSYSNFYFIQRVPGEPTDSTTFRLTNLSEANFTGANLTSSIIEQVNAQSADFSYANLELVQFRQADLSGVNFSNANFSFISTENGELVFLQSSPSLGHDSVITFSLLRDSDFTNATTNGLYVFNSDLRGSNISIEQLSVVDLAGFNLIGQTYSTLDLDGNITSDDSGILVQGVLYVDDRLIGNDQDNILTGGLGDDLYTGGAGNDTFVYTSGVDTVTDFADGDKIDLSALGITFADVDLLLETRANLYTDETETVINYAGNELVVLENYDDNANPLDANDFIF